MKHHYVAWGVAVVAVVAGIVFFTIWHRSEMAVARAEERVKAQDQVIKADKEVIDQAKQHSADVGKQEKEKVQKIETKASKQLDPNEIRQLIDEALKVKAQRIETPTGPVIAVSDTQENRDKIQAAKAQCDICQVERESRTEQLKDADTQIKAQIEQIKALTAQRDTWKETAKGGSKLHRLGKVAKVIGCAGAGAGLGAMLGKTRGAAIGGAAGAGACQLVF